MRTGKRAGVNQFVRTDDGTVVIHKEPPSRKWQKVRLTGEKVPMAGVGSEGESWENNVYYGLLWKSDPNPQDASVFGRLCEHPHALISISSIDESARHDFRDFQRIKNDLVGDEWEAVELYPAESRLVDPSNRFYLFCVPKGVLGFGFSHRNVQGPEGGGPPQRGFA